MRQWLQFKLISLGEAILQSPVSLLLAPISSIWGLVSTIRNWLYDSQWLPTHQAAVPVVSIGNLSVGGTGKTPLVILLAHHFPNRRVAILARGYGAQRGELNDEMKVIQRHLPHARLYQGADRVRLACQAVADGADWILLDDGFQHRRLHRDLDLLILNPRDLTDCYLPRGRLRDSPKRIEKADAVFSYTPLEMAYPSITIRAKPTRIVDRFGQEIFSIRGERVALFCGIGHPSRFKRTVEELGAIVAAEKRLADHEPFLSLDSYFEQCKSLNIRYIICTEKDFVKLPKSKAPLLWIEIQTEVVGGFEEWQNLIAKIGLRLNN